MYSIKNVDDLKTAYNTLMLLEKKNGGILETQELST